jgi:hypothetical protein
MRILHSLAAAMALATSGHPAIIADQTFNNADWAATIVTSDDVASHTETFQQVLTGGNTGAYRDDTHTFSTLGAYSGVQYWNRYTPVEMSLQTSAVTAVTFSMDLILFGTSNQVAYTGGLEQNGKVYRLQPIGVAANTSWTSLSMTGGFASNFCEVQPGQVPSTPDGTYIDCTSNPNFSLGAPNLRVGYLLGSSYFSLAATTGSYHSGIDNFRVMTEGGTVTPEPGTNLLISMGLASLYALERRRASTQQ